jgi:hypothetical protein
MGIVLSPDGEAVTLARLAELITDEEDYDADFLKPTPAAYEVARGVVEGAYRLLGNSPLEGMTSVSGGGGLMLRWKRPPCEVGLRVRPDGDPFLWVGDERDVYLPRSCPAPIGDGGIFLEWGRRGEYVRLLVPPDPQDAYLYCSREQERRTVRTVTPAALAECLRWLLEG